MRTDDFQKFFKRDSITANMASARTVRVPGGGVGESYPLFLYIQTSGAAATAATATLETSDSQDMAGAVVIGTYAIPAEKIGAGGVVFTTALPSGCKNYLRLKFNGPASGTISAGLANTVPSTF